MPASIISFSRSLLPTQPDLAPIVIVGTPAERTLTIAIHGLQHYARTLEALQLAASLVDSPLHVRDHLVLAAAKLKHLGLELHAAIAAFPIQRPQDFQHAADSHYF